MLAYHHPLPWGYLPAITTLLTGGLFIGSLRFRSIQDRLPELALLTIAPMVLGYSIQSFSGSTPIAPAGTMALLTAGLALARHARQAVALVVFTWISLAVGHASADPPTAPLAPLALLVGLDALAVAGVSFAHRAPEPARIPKSPARSRCAELADLPLEPLVHRCTEQVRPTASRKGLGLFVDVEPGTLVRADEDLLEQILLCLLRNAVRHTDSGGIYLDVQPRGEQLAIHIHDTGPGLTTGEIRTLLRPPTPGTHEGGFSLARSLAHSMGATIDVRSLVGRGSTFTLLLPSHLPSRPRAERPGSTRPHAQPP